MGIEAVTVLRGALSRRKQIGNYECFVLRFKLLITYDFSLHRLGRKKIVFLMNILNPWSSNSCPVKLTDLLNEYI